MPMPVSKFRRDSMGVWQSSTRVSAWLPSRHHPKHQCSGRKEWEISLAMFPALMNRLLPQCQYHKLYSQNLLTQLGQLQIIPGADRLKYTWIGGDIFIEQLD